MTVAFYPGSFDPIHLGHVDVVVGASKAFDSLVVGIAEDNNKSDRLISVSKSQELFEAILNDLGITNVSCHSFSGTTVDACIRSSASVLVKGVRSSTDLDDEMVQARINAELAPEIPTVLIPGVGKSGLISSRYVRQLHQLGSPLAGLVPEHVQTFLTAK